MTPDQKERLFAKYRKMQKDAISTCPEYPEGRFKGRGIVMCGGGIKYFTCAWVAICMLRKFKCTLPIELWHLGDMNKHNPEMCEYMEDLMVPLGVTCIDANKLRRQYPPKKKDSWEHCPGWQLNPYSIIHSNFQEILFIDADNVVTGNPEYLFETEGYTSTGAIFWPDYGRLDSERDIWKIMDLEYRDEEEFESGQIIIDKKRCWEALNLTMHLNEHSNFYYQHIHGDKDTYHMAWCKLNQDYTMIHTPIHNLSGVVMCQHDFNGNIIFQHRNMAKWQLNAKMNMRIRGFRHEKSCLTFLTMLSNNWNGIVENPQPLSDLAEKLFFDIVEQERYTYVRVGYDKRIIQFLDNGHIGDGARRLETDWAIEEKPNGDLRLNIIGGEGPTCSLTLGLNGIFSGRWLSHERMPVELIPMKKAKQT